MNIENYILPVFVIAFFGFRFYKNFQVKKEIPILIKNGAKIIDVRSEREFNSGNNPVSVNIPLDKLNDKINELDKDQYYILCCASGTRSAVAMARMKAGGFRKLYNAGSWFNTFIKD